MTARPTLNLGAMAASSVEENIERMEALVATFNVMMGTEMELINDPSGGSTDCKTEIRVPFHDPEAYITCEHEISHPFAGTDLDLTVEFRKKAVERLLTRARIPVTSPDAIPYKKKLDEIVHLLWNVLEDWRCCSVWGEVYFGGASILRQRWKDIAKYAKEEEAKTDLVSYLMRAAAGYDTDGAPVEFKACLPHIHKARNRVELVDNKACLAITARLVDDIADELLKHYPDQPKNPNSKQQQAQAKLGALSKAVPPPGQGWTKKVEYEGRLGKKDLSRTPGQKKKRVTAKTMAEIRRLMTAKDEPEQAGGTTPFQQLCDAGAKKMQKRISAAKAELGKQRKSEANQEKSQLTATSSDCGIPSKHVTPVHPLPRPSKKAAKVRRYLEQVRMEKELTAVRSGSKINMQRFIQARASGNLSSTAVFQKTRETGGLQLMILADVSGSMYGVGLDILDQAISDVEFSCRGLKVDIDLWAFSDDLFFFSKLGSTKNVPGMGMKCTSLVQALDTAAQWTKRGKGDRAIILMTDGFPTSCRAKKSSGNPAEDLAHVMKEIRSEGVVLSVLAIGGQRDYYENVFGKRGFGHVQGLRDLPDALGDAARVIIEAHLR
jgi:hypothetical protein